MERRRGTVRSVGWFARVVVSLLAAAACCYAVGMRPRFARSAGAPSGTAVYAYADRSGRTVYVSKREDVPADLRAKARPVSTGGADPLNVELGNAMRDRTDREYAAMKAQQAAEAEAAAAAASARSRGPRPAVDGEPIGPSGAPTCGPQVPAGSCRDIVKLP